jgi:hypothetical protein
MYVHNYIHTYIHTQYNNVTPDCSENKRRTTVKRYSGLGKILISKVVLSYSSLHFSSTSFLFSEFRKANANGRL